MNANELRIGNYICFAEEDVLFKVVDICKEGLTVENDADKTWIEIESFEPIAITEEWVLNFKFKPYSYLFNDELLEGYVPFNLISQEYNTYILQKYGDKYYMMTNGDSRQIISNGFEYVHQLQNIYFALTNTELKCETK